jgi:hypothetical protein
VADIPVDGKTRIAWVPAIANIAAPTVAELNAGLLLTYRVTRDGLMGYEPTTNKIDNASIGDTFDITTVGTDSFGDTALRLKRQTPLAGDTAYTTLVKGAEGYIVIRRDVDRDTAWTAAQLCEVYPTTCGRRKRLAPEQNTVTRYEVPTMVSSEPDLDAVVA